jgi:hypothetical protein
VTNESTSNRKNAPQCAAFVDAMREAFGDVKVLYVKEKDFTLGAPSDEGVELASATAFDVQREKVLAKA